MYVEGSEVTPPCGSTAGWRIYFTVSEDHVSIITNGTSVPFGQAIELNVLSNVLWGDQLTNKDRHKDQKEIFVFINSLF